MAEQNKRLIAEKRYVWDAFIKRGILLPYVYDIETFGLSYQDVPHPVKGNPVVTEYAHALIDIAGNMLETVQILPRRPKDLLGDPEAPIVLRKSPAEFDSFERDNYFDATAKTLWELEQVPYKYEELADKLGDEREIVNFRVYNSATALKKDPAKLEREEEVIPVPLLDDKGEIVHDVRYHPESRKIAYRVDDDPSSDYHMAGFKVHYYVDMKDNSKWRFVEPRSASFGFNNKNFDNPTMRLNWMRAGMHPSNIFSMYSRAAITSKQRNKNYAHDVRDIMRMVSIYGPQGEDKLKLSIKNNPRTGKPFVSESLAGIIRENTHLENFLRGIPGGLTMPNGELPDLNLAHGAEYDSRMTAGILAYCMQKAPHIVSECLKQDDENDIRTWLTDQDREGERLPLFSMPVKNFPNEPYDNLYAFVGSDIQLGNFKKYLFMKTDGTLHKAMHNNKPLHELSEEEWGQYMEHNFRNPEAVIRTVSFRRWPGALHMDDVLNNTEAGAKWRNNLDDVEQDLIYIKEHPEMMERLYCAVEDMNNIQRQEPVVHNPRIEDDLFKWGFGEPPYTQAITDERREWYKNNPRKKWMTDKDAGPVETIRSRQVDDLRSMNMIDDAMYRLFITPHMVDVIDENHLELEAVIENFNDLVNRIKIKFRKKNIDYIEILNKYLKKHDITFDKKHVEKGVKKGGDEKTLEREFLKQKKKALREIKKFRWKLKKRLLTDYLKEDAKDTSYAQGFVRAKDQHNDKRLLLATAYRGDSFNTPHVVNDAGQVISMDYLSRLEGSDVIEKLKNGEWVNRFYRARSNPAIDIILSQYAEYNRLDELPEVWQKEYQKQKQLKLYGRPNENETVSAFPTIKTFNRKLDALELNVTAADEHALERAIYENTGVAVNLSNFEEARSIIAGSREWIKKLEKDNKFDPKLADNGLYDKKTGLPYDYIPYEIPANNHVIIDVPAHHLRNPIKQYDITLPENCLVIPKPNAEIIARIKKGAPVIVREQETGRLYHTGPTSVNKAPKDCDTRFSSLNGLSRRAYEHAGQPFPDYKNRIVLGIEGLYPVANSRHINPDIQTFKLPNEQFDGLVYPEIANLPKHVRGLIVPAEYVSQELTPGKIIRLRETHGQRFDNIRGDAGEDTGHIYDTKLKQALGLDANGNAKGISVKKFFNDIASGKISQKLIEKTGFQSKDHIEKTLRDWSSDMLKKDFEKLKVVFAEFAKVNKGKWGYWQPQEAPMAAMTRNGVDPVPPSAYRPSFKGMRRK